MSEGRGATPPPMDSSDDDGPLLPVETAAAAVDIPSILRQPKIAQAEAQKNDKVKGWYTGKPKDIQVKIPQPAMAKPAAAAEPAAPPAPAQLPADAPIKVANKSVVPGPLRKRYVAAKSVLGKRKKPAVKRPPSPKKKKTASTKTKAPAAKAATAKAPADASNVRLPAKEIYSGPATEAGVPPGWTKKIFERQSGQSKGHQDRYWYSPVHKMKFRSLTEIKRFVPLLEAAGGDEKAAWKEFKKR